MKSLRKIALIVLWVALAAILAVWGTLVCAVRMLDREPLTLIANRVANRTLDGAAVDIRAVDLHLRGHFPFLTIDIDSITVLSRDMTRLDDSLRNAIPAWSDTLLTVDHLTGGINLTALLRQRIELHDVIFTRPGINIVTVTDSINNYTLVTPSTDDSTDTDTTAVLPDISINRFILDNPRPIRYANAVTGDSITVRLSTAAIEGADDKLYRLAIDGHLDTPLLGKINMSTLSFGANGGIEWQPRQPGDIALRDFNLYAACLRACVDARISFGRDIVIDDYDLRLDKVNVSRILELLPADMASRYGIGNIRADADISLNARSTAPFNLTTDSLPHAIVEMQIADGRITDGHMSMRDLAATVKANIRGNDLDDAIITVDNLHFTDPATSLSISATARHIISDPHIDGEIRGYTDLRRLPTAVADKLGGRLGGHITADIKLRGSASMLTRNNFHRIYADGDIDGDNIFYRSNDTTTAFTARHACLRFGTSRRVENSNTQLDSLLAANIRVDSMRLLHDDIIVDATDFAMGAASSNRSADADSTTITQVGAGISAGSFNIHAIADSLILRARNVKGRVGLRACNDDPRRPMFSFNLTLGKLGAGSSRSRLLVTSGALKGSIAQLPDSLTHRRPRRPRNRRMRSAMPDSLTEYIDWGTSSEQRRLLLGWRISGNFTTRRAALFTPYFPLRNSIDSLNATFNNDSITFNNIRYNTGRSDFTMSGTLSNIRRSFTSRSHRQPLRLHLDISSDTIDINQIAECVFRGSAYAAANTGSIDFSAIDSIGDNSDEAFDRTIDRYIRESPESEAPLLIPVNLEADMSVRADNILYSDLLLHDMRGSLLMFDGALNIHRLRARSEIGSVSLSALYSAPQPDSIRFGFGLQADRCYIQRFLQLAPAIDSLMPIMRDISGIIDANIAATVDIDRGMNMILPTLDAAVKISGDSLTLIDPETFKTVAKWLLFRNKNRNIINHMDVELIVRDNMLAIYPFMFDFDRYRLGVQGYNDLAMNFDYHISVLKSPLPFRFGINVKGNPDKYKIRLGGARFNEKTAGKTVAIVDTVRINLLNQIENIFARGVRRSKFARLQIDRLPQTAKPDVGSDTISRADSLIFINEGLIPAAPAPATSTPK